MMTIGELARRAGIRPSRIRYYEKLGLLPAPERRSGMRSYDSGALEAIRNVLVAQRLGLSLTEIGALRAGTSQLEAVARTHAREVDEAIRRARIIRVLLRHAARTKVLPVERYGRILAKIGV